MTDRTVAELTAQHTDVERMLMDATHANALARSRLPKLLTSRDDAKAQTCRLEISTSHARMGELTAEAEALREAIKEADADEVEEARRYSYGDIHKAVVATTKDAQEIDSILEALGEAIKILSQSKEAADAKLQRAGIAPLRDHLTAAMVKNLIEMKLYVSTDGAFGKAVTLDSLHQLKQSGRANLSKAASDYSVLTLQHAARTLGVDPAEAA